MTDMASRPWTYGLSRNLILLGLASLLNDVSSEMILPLIPFFVTEVLAAGPLVLGFIDGVSESVVSLLKIGSGVASDRAGRRKAFVVGGYGISGATKGLFAFARSWPVFFGLRVFERAGKGVRDPPRDALIAESTPPEAYGKAFGFHRSMDTTGAILGPLLVLLLLPGFLAVGSQDTAYRTLFLLAAIPAAAAFGIVWWVRDPGRPRVRRSLRLSLTALPPRLRAFVLIATLFSLAQFSYAFLLLRAGGVEGTFTAIALYLLFNVFYTIIAYPAGILSDRVGRVPVIAGGYAAFAGMSVVLAATTGLAWLVVGFLLYSVSFAFVEGVERAFVSELSPEDLRGTALGTFHAATGLGKLPSSIVAGALWVAFGYPATFAFGLVVSVAALIALASFATRPARS